MAKYQVTTAEGIQEVNTLKEIQELLGLRRAPKLAAIEAGTFPMITILDSESAEVEELDTVGVELEPELDNLDLQPENEVGVVTEDVSQDENLIAENADVTPEEEQVNPENVIESEPIKVLKTSPKAKKKKAKEPVDKFPELGTFTEEKALKKHYRKLTNEELDEWLELEGLEYKPSDHEAIDRMRKCMAILYYHFPKQTTSKKKKSKYGQYSTEELVRMASENNVKYESTDSAPILRMRVIMALREAGVAL